MLRLTEDRVRHCIENPELAELFWPDLPELYAVAKALYDIGNVQIVNSYAIIALRNGSENITLHVYYEDDVNAKDIYTSQHAYETIYYLIAHRVDMSF